MMTQMDLESDGAASQEHRSTAKCSTRKVEMPASASTAVQALKQRRLHPGAPCIPNIPWWTTSSPRGGDGHVGNETDDHMETHRAQGKQEPVKEAESKVMTDSLKQQAESKNGHKMSRFWTRQISRFCRSKIAINKTKR